MENEKWEKWTQTVSKLISAHRNEIREKYVAEKHYIGGHESWPVDRTHYDTPNSIMGCPCSSCNKSRHRKHKIKFPAISITVLNIVHDNNSRFYYNEPVVDDYQVFISMGSVEICILEHGNVEY